MENEWAKLRSIIYDAASETVGLTQRRHQDWFDNSSPAIQELLEIKRKAHAAVLSNPYSPSLRTRYKAIRGETQKQLRTMENEWWLKKAEEIQRQAEDNNAHAFYEAVKSLYGLQKRNIAPVRFANGSELFKEQMAGGRGALWGAPQAGVPPRWTWVLVGLLFGWCGGPGWPLARAIVLWIVVAFVVPYPH
ncbi:uncharacterized protein LOC125980616 [Xyrichtys novacula]|uniref:Uncharacterized protein LOC125980616 n=1 Tax=Xyrichtys novacula TaxID=13765 RepID=A0AAV1FG77_XYRNO|nr:uncharacterized protein LOC125980616 [Xyrichtys novacula]